MYAGHSTSIHHDTLRRCLFGETRLSVYMTDSSGAMTLDIEQSGVGLAVYYTYKWAHTPHTRHTHTLGIDSPVYLSKGKIINKCHSTELQHIFLGHWEKILLTSHNKKCKQSNHQQNIQSQKQPTTGNTWARSLHKHKAILQRGPEEDIHPSDS